jgi:N-acyl-D-amino-acid deacylase
VTRSSTATGDLLVRGGDVVDGTGAPSRTADVRVRAGTIVEVGPALRPDGEAELDAAGCVVTPGFVDTHTHHDPSLWWDPTVDPMPLHGVTTVVVGNCSLSLAPLRADDPAVLETVLDAFCFIEDMPVSAFRTGIPWDWTDWSSWTAGVGARGLGAHVGALVGHSTLRLAVLGGAAMERASTDDERAQLVAALDACLAAGALGLSTSFADVDRAGRPVASRLADEAELAALVGALDARGRSILEFLPRTGGDEKVADIERIHQLCARTGVRASWTQLASGGRTAELVPVLLEQAGRTQAEGAGVFPQVSPRSFDIEINLDQTVVFVMQPTWNAWVQQDEATKRRLLTDPAWRDTARREWDAVPYSLFPKGRMHKLRVSGVVRPDLERLLGQPFTDVIDEQPGVHEADVFADWVLANDLRPGLTVVGLANDDPAEVGALLRDPRIVLGGSDAGAHLQMLCGAGDSSLLLARHVVERGDLELEQAVRLLTAHAARTFGIRDRGAVAVGQAGDLVVFDPAAIRWPDDELVRDLPDGSARLTRPWGGYRSTVVAGTPVQLDGAYTGARPGTVLDGAAAG